MQLSELLKPNGELSDSNLFPNLTQLKAVKAEARDLSSCKEERVKRGRESIQYFASTYFPHHCPLDFGEHHLDIFEVVQSPETNKLIVRVEPRKSGKSTIMCTIVPAWWLAYQLKWFIVLFGASHHAVLPHFSALQEELDPDSGNELLLDDFPHLRPAVDFKGQFVKWDDHKVVFANEAIVEARSLYGKFRGLKERHRRPDAMIVDDPQDEEDVGTAYRRDKVLTRFRKTLMSLGGENCDIYALGNLMDKDSLLANLLRDPMWNGKLYMAENVKVDKELEEFPIGNTKEDNSALWEAGWPLLKLRDHERKVKTHAYNIEMMNRTRGLGDQVYDSMNFKRFRLSELNLDKSFRVIMFWDPADPKEGRSTSDSDYVCQVVVARKIITWLHEKRKHTIPYYWVIEAWLERGERGAPDAAIANAFSFLRTYAIRDLVYEANTGFGTMLPYLREKAKELDIHLPLRLITQTHNKERRILHAQPVVSDRTFFADHLSHQYFSQWDDFPKPTAHDDGPDATVGCIEYFEKKVGGFAFGG
jgi:hypothetical protein